MSFLHALSNSVFDLPTTAIVHYYFDLIALLTGDFITVVVATVVVIVVVAGATTDDLTFFSAKEVLFLIFVTLYILTYPSKANLKSLAF